MPALKHGIRDRLGELCLQSFADFFRSHGNILVGDNEPYSGKDIAYSLDMHAGAAGLPNCAIEIRQDHLETFKEAVHWAAILGDSLEEILAIENLHSVEHF